MRSSASVTALLSGISLLALTTAAPANDIGSVAAVNQDMQGTAPGGSPRQLQIREAVVEQERIQTSDSGSGQLVFVDQTTLTVSAKSDITLDRYIFDASADQGDMALTMTRGAMRFIGGRISKKRRAVVRTPTATIGIRGGLVIIQVADDGSTRVTQLAGESTTVVSYGDSDNDGVDDGPTGEDQESFLAGDPVDGENVIVLSRAGATADAYPQDVSEPVFDGTGFDDDEGDPDGGTTTEGDGDGSESEVVYTGVAESDDLQEVYDDFEGDGSGGTEERPTNEAVDRSTSDVAQVNSDVEGGSQRNPVSTSGEEPVESSSPDEPVENPVQQTPLIQQQGAEQLAGLDPEDPEVPFVPEPPIVDPPEPPVLPPPPPLPPGQVPPSGGVLILGEDGIFPFVDVQLGSLIGILGEPVDGIQAIVLDVPDSPDGLLETHPLLNVGYFAQTRFPNSGFFDVDVTALPTNEQAFAPGFIVFNDDNNIEFAIGEILDEEGLAPVVFGNATPGQGNAFANDPAAGPAGNSSTPFVAEQLVANDFDFEPFEIQLISNGSGGGDGGRILVAEFTLDSQTGVRDFSVAAGGLIRDAGGPEIDIVAQSTFTDPVGIGFGPETAFEIAPFSALEDNDGNSLFGPDNDFLILTSPFGPNGVESGFAFVQSNFPTDIQSLDPEIFLFTQDPAGKQINADPLGLANHGGSRATPGPVFDSVLAAGFVTCSAGRSCSNESNTYALRPEPLVTQGELSTAGQFDFLPGGSDNNSVQSLFILSDNGLSNIDPGTDADPSQFIFTADAEDSAYFTDQVFGASSQGSTAVIAGTDQFANVLISSSEALNATSELSFPAGINPTPLFATWGFWAASFDVVENGNQVFDTDIVDLGTWVSGVRPDPTDFQNFTGVAGFDGPVVATMQDLNNRGPSQIVTGKFDLTYNFTTDAGDFTLDIPDAGVANQIVAVSQTGAANSPSYGGQGLTSQFSTRVDGVFYSSPTDVVAATGGVVDVTDSVNGRQTLGIFAGDKK